MRQKFDFKLDALHWVLLFAWTAIAAMLRFANLDSKPLWTDEFSTLVFSLGNSFQGVPLDRGIPLEVLLAPLKPHPGATVGDAIARLLTESNHPPVYFALAHWWMQMFAPVQGYASLWGARSLAAFLGVVSVPAIYSLGCLAFRSRLVGQMAAAMMAISPYAIYLAQEARHYTLAILLVIASLSCLLMATRCVEKRISLPVWLGLLWVAINGLGIAVHYFFSLTLCAEAIVFTVILWMSLKGDKVQLASPPIPFLEGEESRTSPFPSRERGLGRLGLPYQNSIKLKPENSLIKAIYLSSFSASFLLPVIGTIASGLVWLPIFYSSRYGDELTQWIQSSDRTGFAWISPIFQALAGWITIVSLLPVESSSLSVVIVSAIAMVIFFIWALPLFYKGIKICYSLPENRLSIVVLIGFVLSAIALFFGFTYFLNIDLTRGARYNFVYFPAAIVLVGASLAFIFNTSIVKSQFFKLSDIKISGKKAVILILIMGLLSGVTVVSNLGYQKYYKPDLLVSIIREISKVPVLIATTHNTHVQTGEMMGIAWEWEFGEIGEMGRRMGKISYSSHFKAQNHVDLGNHQGLALSVQGSNVKIPSSPPPFFLLAHQQREVPEMPAITLRKTLDRLDTPLDLWLVNFHTPVNLESKNCSLDSRSFPPVDGYNYQLYHCLNRL
ncbi:glycosyltransferase [Kamptonema animale CS-326]|uniref:glycosyltransferase family 39 protein n=1 Tax=Kamptonema animale TaxID=92934 RepID=UPI00232D90EE|nr:glycosyltransferase [Kamptonema animale]MDB9512532.1 glycosyltransferase [Kamptonema animale CS-326]